MKPSKGIALLILLSLFLILFFGSFVLAQRQLEVEYPEFGGIKPETTTIGLPNYIKYIFNFSLGIAGLIAFAALIYGGIRYLTSAGSATIMKDAKEQILAAILGLLVLLSSYLILTTINPQLVFLNLPEILKTATLEIFPPPPEENILSYTEIPIGGLVGDILSEERMDRIKNVLKEAKNSSKKIEELTQELNKLAQEEKILAQELRKLIADCSCKNTNPWTKGCAYGQPCPVSQLGSCQGDPCPNRREILATNEKIEAKKKEIKEATKVICEFMYSSAGEKTEVDPSCKKLIDLKSILKEQSTKGLKYWQRKLEIEIFGSKEGDKEKIVGIKTVYEGLKKAEESIKKCSLSKLFGYNDFWKYKKALEEEITGEEPEKPWDYITVDAFNLYYSATFYCVEAFYSIPEGVLDTELSEEELEKIQQKAEAIQEEELREEEKILCPEEIPIGQAVDNAQAFAEEFIGKLTELNQKTKNIIQAVKDITSNALAITEVENFTRLIQEIKSYGCFSGCDEWVESYDCGTEKEPATCYTYHCRVAPIPCAGTPGTADTPFPQAGIESKISFYFINRSANIQNLFNKIKEEKEKISQIQKETLGSFPQMSEIFKKLDIAKNKIGACYNTVKTHKKIFRGEETSFLEFYSCQGREVPLYKKTTEEEIKDCYGPEPGKEDRLSNYFCCEVEISL